MSINEKALKAFRRAFHEWKGDESARNNDRIVHSMKAYEAAKSAGQPCNFGRGDCWICSCPNGEHYQQPVSSSLPERDPTKPAEQQGVFRKFDVRRTDGSSEPGGKHHGCEYFVLDVNHDQYAKIALAVYAHACRETHPDLSKDMIARYDLIQPGATEREIIDRWKLAKWLYDYEAEVDSHGVQLKTWEDREQRTRDAYYHLAGDCIETITQIEGGES